MNITEPKTDIISRLIAHVTDECETVDVEQRFCDSLDECYDFEKIGGPFAGMQASRVLREVDPMAYRCGLNDEVGCDESLVEINGDYYDAREVSDAQDEFVSELETEETTLEEEIEELETEDSEREENGEGPENESEILVKQSELEALRASITTARKYTF